MRHARGEKSKNNACSYYSLSFSNETFTTNDESRLKTTWIIQLNSNQKLLGITYGRVNRLLTNSFPCREELPRNRALARQMMSQLRNTLSPGKNDLPSADHSRVEKEVQERNTCCSRGDGDNNQSEEALSYTNKGSYLWLPKNHSESNLVLLQTTSAIIVIQE